MPENIEDYRAVIAVNVRRYRKAVGLSQTKLVVKTGIAQTTISDIERKGKPFSLNVAYKLAHAFGCTVHDLLPPTSADVVAELLASRASA
jgi:transcriptional regulator with XRE-family HTH domain